MSKLGLEIEENTLQGKSVYIHIHMFLNIHV